MIDRRARPLRSARYRSSGINREASPLRALTVPYASILAGSLLPVLLLQADVMPLSPPLGFMMLLAWRLMRPGLLPIWAGVPLGLFDDCISGQPIGSAVFLWSLAMIALEYLEQRIPWRGFWQDWFTACLAIVTYILAAMALSRASVSTPLLVATVPQIMVAAVLYPLLARLVSRLDRFRLARTRRIG
ncbi:MAG: rod shape-determining protein MreD [Erythrobacter sp.]|uniref:rod shape-determining protein MreD n=1 Tax=Erythrobacter sp. TaxID=1042 RepID=UPI0032ED3D4B